MHKEEIAELISRCVEQRARGAAGRVRWRSPLVAVAAADDPLFAQLREAVRPSHAMPADLLPGARSVIVFFVPFKPWIGAGNREGRLSSPDWATTYLETNALIGEIGAAVAGRLESRGARVRTMPATHNFDPTELVSDWSHRHVAYVAGLGTFGVNNMLITARGCCGRLGSLVTTAALSPDPRPAAELCLYKRDGSCAECAARCVNAALFVDRFERHRCHAMLRENEQAHARRGRADVCGKCVVGLPCSHARPVRSGRGPRRVDGGA